MQFLEYLGRPEDKDNLFDHWKENTVPAVEKFQCGSLYRDKQQLPTALQDPLGAFITNVDTFIAENQEKVCCIHF